MELRAVVADLLRDGASRERVYADLGRLRDELRAAGKTDQAEVVADVMDFVVGWSSPHVAL